MSNQSAGKSPTHFTSVCWDSVGNVSFHLRLGFRVKKQSQLQGADMRASWGTPEPKTIAERERVLTKTHCASCRGLVSPCWDYMPNLLLTVHYPYRVLTSQAYNSKNMTDIGKNNYTDDSMSVLKILLWVTQLHSSRWSTRHRLQIHVIVKTNWKLKVSNAHWNHSKNRERRENGSLLHQTLGSFSLAASRGSIHLISWLLLALEHTQSMIYLQSVSGSNTCMFVVVLFLYPDKFTTNHNMLSILNIPC